MSKHGKITMNNEVKEILRLHELYMKGDSNGVRADLTNKDLQYAYLEGVNLEGANLEGANLNRANLNCANLKCTKLMYANLEETSLNRADLQYSNLNCANLKGASLRGANLRYSSSEHACFGDIRIEYCIGNSIDLFSMQLSGWGIAFTQKQLAIGCQQHSIEEWKKFSDKEIDVMDCEALVFWRKWKDHIFQTIELTLKGAI